MKGKIEKLHKLLKNKEISPFSLTEKYLERIKEEKPLNAFITVTEKEKLLPLLVLPCAPKDARKTSLSYSF